MIRNVHIIALAIGLALGQPARADVVCPMTIASLRLSPDGWANLSLVGPDVSRSWWFCSVQGTVVVDDGFSATRSITSDSCKAIYSELLTAATSGKPIQLSFTGPASCSDASLPASGGVPIRFPYNIGINP